MFAYDNKDLNKNSLDGELSLSYWNGINKLKSRPQPVEFAALIYVDDPICRWRSYPNRIVQKAPESVQNNFEYGQTTAEPFTSQQITFSGY